MDDVQEIDKVQCTATPPGRRILRSMASTTRSNFYKLTDAIPKISGRTGDFIDLNDDDDDGDGRKTTIDAREAIWRKIRKTEPSRNGDSESKSAKNRELEVPGAKLRMLKNDLEPKMREQRKEGLQKRYELWNAEGGSHKKKQKEESEDSLDPSKKIENEVDIEEPDADEDDDEKDKMTDGQERFSKADEVPSVDKTENVAQQNFKSPNKVHFGLDEATNDQFDFTVPSNSLATVSRDSPPRMFNCSRSLDEIFFPSPTFETDTSLPEALPNEDEDLDNISATRKLLGRVINEGDSQPPNSQDILDACSGQFIMEKIADNRKNEQPPVPNSKPISSTPSAAKVPKFFDIFKANPRRSRLDFEQKQSADENADRDAVVDEEETGRPTNDTEQDDAMENVDEQLRECKRKNRNRLLSNSDEEGGESDGEEDDGEPEDDEGEEEEENEEEEMDEDDADEGDEGGGKEVDEEEVYLRMEKERREYFDNEAELSGSDDEHGDDNEDGNEKDEWEPEAGDQDELPSEGELRSQVGRVHWKQMMDDDKRQLLKYKEAYLRGEEADAQAVNFRFRWKRGGGDDDDDDFGNDGNDGGPEGEVTTLDDDEAVDEGWRESLKERAKWLTKHGIAVEDALADVDDSAKGSLLFKEARAALHRSASLTTSNGATDQASVQSILNRGVSFLHHSVSIDAGTTSMFFRRESLLKRAAGLLKLAGGDGNGSTAVVSRNKNSAIFTMISPPKKVDADKEKTEKKRASNGEHTMQDPKKRKLFGSIAKMISDMQDILDVQQQEQQVLTKESLMHGEKKKKPPKPLGGMMFKRPEGMAREVYNLLRRDKTALAPLIPTITSTKMGGYKHMKARLGLRRVRSWAWTPFMNPARKDMLQLNHWRRTEDADADYQFAKFNRVLEIPSYTNDEYNKLLVVRHWSKDETDHMMELCGRFDLRWPVMLDRWESSKFPTKRTIEDMKERYYYICNQLAVSRTTPGENPPLIYFDVDNERRRKEQLNKLWNRTKEQVIEEEHLIQEKKRIEARKLDRERKASDLQKLISAAELAPLTPIVSAAPSTAPKKKLPRMPSLQMSMSETGAPEVVASGLKFPDFRGAGVHLRSHRMKLPPTLGQKKAKAIEQSLDTLAIEPHPMASDEIVTQFNELRSDVVLLFELKSALATSEFELEALRHQYRTMTGKDLVIPSRLRVNSDNDAEEAATSPFKRRIADALDISSGPIPPRKRKAIMETSNLHKKLRKNP